MLLMMLTPIRCHAATLRYADADYFADTLITFRHDDYFRYFAAMLSARYFVVDAREPCYVYVIFRRC